jgi:hypothetical protein
VRAFFSQFLSLLDYRCSFLNDLERIATREYSVSDNDIVRARLRTVGIQEHRLKFQNGPWDNPKSVLSHFIYLSDLTDVFRKSWEGIRMGMENIRCWRVSDLGMLLVIILNGHLGLIGARISVLRGYLSLIA